MFEKIKLARDTGLTMANLHDKLHEIHGHGRVIELDTPLEYKCLSGDKIVGDKGLEFVNRAGGALLEIGVRKGDVVAIVTGNNADLAQIIFAVQKIGAIAVPLNYMLKPSEIKYIVENAEASALITDREVFDENIRDRSLLPNIEKWIMAGPAHDNLEGFVSLDDAMVASSSELAPADISPNDPVAIFYTSGTTGFPKGAVMTSNSLLTGQKIASAILPAGKRDYGLMVLPQAHVMGFCVSLMGMMSGLSGYYMKRFHPTRALQTIQDKRVTFFVGVPAMYSMMIQEGLEKYDLSSIRGWGSAADAMPQEHIDVMRQHGAMVKLFGKRLLRPIFAEAYGMVELAGICMLKIVLPGLSFKKGCVGFPVYPFKVKVVDENNNKLPPGKVGELAVKGPGVTKGYWKNEEATREVKQGDWFRTGDLAMKNRFGLVYFVDRAKDVVKTGGYSVFSVEVEREVLEHPAVGQAAVIGVPHPTKKEVPVAIVSLKPGEELTEEELLSWCEENIAAYKRPRAIKIVPAEEMPYGMTMKVLKRQLKERFGPEYAERFAAQKTASS